MNFTPSPTKKVRVVDEDGKVIKTVPMNRATRRRLKVRSKYYGKKNVSGDRT